MDELIGRLVADIGIDQATALKAVSITLAFLANEGPPDTVKALIDRLPGAQTAIDTVGLEAGAGGMMGTGMKLMAAGLSMTQIQGVVRGLIAYAREQGGENELAEIARSIPSLSQFV
jgi:hypothetical protein